MPFAVITCLMQDGRIRQNDDVSDVQLRLGIGYKIESYQITSWLLAGSQKQANFLVLLLVQSSINTEKVHQFESYYFLCEKFRRVRVARYISCPLLSVAIWTDTKWPFPLDMELFSNRSIVIIVYCSLFGGQDGLT